MQLFDASTNLLMWFPEVQHELRHLEVRFKGRHDDFDHRELLTALSAEMTSVQLQCTKCMISELVGHSMMPTFRSPSQRRGATKEERVCACSSWCMLDVPCPNYGGKRLLFVQHEVHDIWQSRRISKQTL